MDASDKYCVEEEIPEQDTASLFYVKHGPSSAPKDDKDGRVIKRTGSECKLGDGLDECDAKGNKERTTEHCTPGTFGEYKIRLDSLKKWPYSSVQSPSELADAGFYYTGNRDLVKCLYCDGTLQHWEPGDGPLVEHLRWYPDCVFVQQLLQDK